MQADFARDGDEPTGSLRLAKTVHVRAIPPLFYAITFVRRRLARFAAIRVIPQTPLGRGGGVCVTIPYVEGCARLPHKRLALPGKFTLT